jgi:hypothetical protein
VNFTNEKFFYRGFLKRECRFGSHRRARTPLAAVSPLAGIGQGAG